MRQDSFGFVRAAGVRRAVVREGDIREDIAFQNDINTLLARFDGKTPPLTALGWIREPVAQPVDRLTDGFIPRPSLRVINGGNREMTGFDKLSHDGPRRVLTAVTA